MSSADVLKPAATAASAAPAKASGGGGGGGGGGHKSAVRTANAGSKRKNKHDRSSRKRSKSFSGCGLLISHKPVLPSKFLLGGNIKDPLNLSSLQDEEINRAMNAVTPKSSPVPTPPRKKGQIEVIIPRNIRDPLNLIDCDDDADYEQQLCSPVKKNRKKRMKKRRTISGTMETSACADSMVEAKTPEASTDSAKIPEVEQASCEDEQQSQQEKPATLAVAAEEQPTTQPQQQVQQKKERGKRKSDEHGTNGGGTGSGTGTNTNSNPAKKFKNAMDKIVSPVVPQPGAWLKRANSTTKRPPHRATDGKKKDEAGELKMPQFKDKDKRYQYGNYDRYYGYRNPGNEMDPRLRILTHHPYMFENKDILDIGCNIGHITLSIARDLGAKSVLGVDIDSKLIAIARKNVRHYVKKEAMSPPSATSIGTAPSCTTSGTAPIGTTSGTATIGTTSSTSTIGTTLGTATIGTTSGTATIGTTSGTATISTTSCSAPSGITADSTTSASITVKEAPSTGTSATPSDSTTSSITAPISDISIKPPKNAKPKKTITSNPTVSISTARSTTTISNMSTKMPLKGTKPPPKGGGTKGTARGAQKSTGGGGGCEFFPISMPILYGNVDVLGSYQRDRGGTANAAMEQKGCKGFPDNVTFKQCNYVLEDESLLANEQPQFDVILCLSMTKWIHLNWGDAGIKQAFRRMYAQLRPGGKLILEPQNWAGYKKRKRLTETIFKNYNTIEFFPEKFREYLLSPAVGFAKGEILGMPLHRSKGFRRPIQVFTKSTMFPSERVEATPLTSGGYGSSDRLKTTGQGHGECVEHVYTDLFDNRYCVSADDNAELNDQIAEELREELEKRRLKKADGSSCDMDEDFDSSMPANLDNKDKLEDKAAAGDKEDLQEATTSEGRTATPVEQSVESEVKTVATDAGGSLLEDNT